MASDRSNSNAQPALLAKSNAGNENDVLLWADPVTHRLLVDASVSISSVSGDKTSNGAAPGSNNLGVLAGIATAAAPSYTEGRMVGLSTDLSGALRVTGSLSVGGFTDDSAFTPASSTGNIIMGFVDDTAPDSVDEGDGGAVRMSANRNLYVRIRDNAGNERGLNIDANGELGVSGIRTAVQTVGSVAHDAVGTGANPILVGGYASAAAPANVSADGDAVRAWYLLNGAQATVLTAAGALIGGDATNGLDVDVTRVPADPFGLNADAASATGSISAKLRFIAATGIPVTAVTPGTAATSLAKARDAVAGATDTNLGIMMIRRDTPTAVTPIAGDYEVPQISANGEQWVRLAGELADDAAFTVATTRVLPIGFLADETATDSVDEGDIGAARMTLDRRQIVVPQSYTAGGATPYRLISAASTNATSVKASAGQVYSIAAFNTNAAVRYLKLYNLSVAPTVGTSTPVQTYALPGATTGGGFTLSIPVGMEFTTGIALALTTGAADTDTGAVAANEIVISLSFR